MYNVLFCSLFIVDPKKTGFRTLVLHLTKGIALVTIQLEFQKSPIAPMMSSGCRQFLILYNSLFNTYKYATWVWEYVRPLHCNNSLPILRTRKAVSFMHCISRCCLQDLP